MTDATENEELAKPLAKPNVIGNLIFVGNAVLWLSAMSGVILLILSTKCIDHCEYSFKTLAYEEEPMLVVFGVALIIGGWVQQQFIHGFSVGLDQLFEIRKNTSK
jgi:hypothetical protein